MHPTFAEDNANDIGSCGVGRPSAKSGQSARQYAMDFATTIHRAINTDVFDDVCLRDRTAAMLWESWRALLQRSQAASVYPP